MGGCQCAVYTYVFTLVHTAHGAPGALRQGLIFSRETDGRNLSHVTGRSDATGEFHSFQILAQTANIEPLLSNTKPDGWMLAIFKKEKKNEIC